jgi:Phage P2 baseplate assembly protein gpV
MDNVIRVGTVSAINYNKGNIAVAYLDRQQTVTAELPMLSNGKYKMPRIGEQVLVLHLTTGSAMGVVVGSIWNDVNVPSGEKGLFRQELAEELGGAYIAYKDGRLTIKASQVEFRTDNGVITLDEIIERL